MSVRAGPRARMSHHCLCHHCASHRVASFLWFYDQFQWRHLNMADQTKAKELKSRWQMLSLIPIPQWIKFSFFGRSGCPRPKFNVKEYNAQWVKNIFDGNFISCFHEIFMKSRWQMLKVSFFLITVLCRILLFVFWKNSRIPKSPFEIN